MRTTVKTTETLNKAIPADAKIFVTDYASYNEGTQFEFGQWVDLASFKDAEDLRQNLIDHFSYCDTVRPLECGTPREEIMITDFEGFPSFLYSECMNFDQLYEYFEKLDFYGFNQEIIEAFASIDTISLEYMDSFFADLENRYFGKFDNKKDFAMEYAEVYGNHDFSKLWPVIDWDRSADDLMTDYTEENGHYFYTSER